MNAPSDLTKRMTATLRLDVIAPGSTAHEYAIARSQFAEALQRIRELEAIAKPSAATAVSGNN